MSETKRKVRPPKRWGLRVAVLLGLLLGLLAVLFFLNVYNPFGAAIDSPLVLLPPDADFVLNLPDVPGFLGTVRETDLALAMESHKGFQEFLRSEAMRDRGVVEAVRDAFQYLDSLSHSLPLGLRLFPDVSGHHVFVAGYLPGNESEPLRVMLTFRPGSWKAIAGVNILLNPRLCDWFATKPLKDQGIGVEHTRDMVALHLPARGVMGSRVAAAPRKIWVTRLADVVLVSTEERQLAQIRNSVERDGIPARADPRYAGLDEYLGAHPVQLLVRRNPADSFVGLTGRLDEAWGPALRQKVESSLPRLGGEDVILSLDFGRTLALQLRGDRGEIQPGSLGALFAPFARTRFEEEAHRLGRFLPAETFALAHFRAPLGDLVDALLATEMDEGDRRLLEEGFSKMRTVESRAALRSRLNQLATDRISVAFFKQPRETLSDQAQAGFVLACRLDRAEPFVEYLESMFAEMAQNADSGIREAVRMPWRSGVLWKLVFAAGVVNDSRVTMPGIGIFDGYLLASNFLPFLMQIPDAQAGRIDVMGRHPGIEEAVAYAPSELLFAGVLDGRAIEPYLDQSAPGWAYSRTRVTQMDMMRFHEAGRRFAEAQGLVPGTEAFDQEVESFKVREESQRAGAERERELRKIQELADQFRGFFSSLGFFVEATAGGVGFSVRVVPRRE